MTAQTATRETFWITYGKKVNHVGSGIEATLCGIDAHRHASVVGHSGPYFDLDGAVRMLAYHAERRNVPACAKCQAAAAAILAAAEVVEQAAATVAAEVGQPAEAAEELAPAGTSALAERIAAWLAPAGNYVPVEQFDGYRTISPLPLANELRGMVAVGLLNTDVLTRGGRRLRAFRLTPAGREAFGLPYGA